MLQKMLTVTGLTFSMDGRRVGCGAIITADGETPESLLTAGMLQMGHLRGGAPELVLRRPYRARYEGRGDLWLTFAPDRFLLREAPQIEPVARKA